MPTLFKLALRALLCCLPFAAVQSAAAADVTTGFTDTLVAGGLRSPTAMAFAPDGRLFVAEQGGTLRVIKDGVLLTAPFVTLTVNASGERGLLGVAFDPEFATSRFVYVYYTATTPVIHNRVSRFTADGDVAVAGSEQVLLDLEPLGATNHNGGAIHFGRDGRLYVAVGDNAVGSNAQTLANRLGKMLRINPDGSIPSDNPFFGTATGNNRAIWALGLRNPYTFAVEPLSGALFINDVGENTWEEVNEGVAGANYGWPTTEGPTSNPAFRTPLLAYTHADGCAISGATFHSLTRRAQFPFAYWGAYFFGDYCGGWIGARKSDGGVLALAWGITRPVDLQMGSDGSLYYLARGPSSNTGLVGRIDYVATAPGVDFTANGQDGPLTLTAGNPLQIDFGFDAGAGGVLASAEMYVALATPFGFVWLDPTQGFVPNFVPVYTGALPTFGPVPLIQVPDVATLAPGIWIWMILVDQVADGVPTGEFSDYVVTVIN